jgi:hypothetical protein
LQPGHNPLVISPKYITRLVKSSSAERHQARATSAARGVLYFHGI